LSDWAPCSPVAFEEHEVDEALAKMSSKALDALVAAGKISEKDRDRVVFLVHTISHPTTHRLRAPALSPWCNAEG
jgi:hypothetical protein